MVLARNVTLFFIVCLVGADELLLGPINDLSVMPESVTFFVTAYSLANAVYALFFGVLSDRYGRMRILISASILFAAASIGTGLVARFEMALFFRVLTGERLRDVTRYGTSTICSDRVYKCPNLHLRLISAQISCNQR